MTWNEVTLFSLNLSQTDTIRRFSEHGNVLGTVNITLLDAVKLGSKRNADANKRKPLDHSLSRLHELSTLATRLKTRT